MTEAQTPSMIGVLIGRRGDEAWKTRLVDLATDLHAYELEVVLTVLVGTGGLLGLGTDLVVSRWYRRLTSRG